MCNFRGPLEKCKMLHLWYIGSVPGYLWLIVTELCLLVWTVLIKNILRVCAGDADTVVANTKVLSGNQWDRMDTLTQCSDWLLYSVIWSQNCSLSKQNNAKSATWQRISKYFCSPPADSFSSETIESSLNEFCWVQAMWGIY